MGRASLLLSTSSESDTPSWTLGLRRVGSTWNLPLRARPQRDGHLLPPAEAVAAQLADFTLEIDFSWSLKYPAPLWTAVNLNQNALFALTFHEPQSLERCLELVLQLRNFVALGVGRPVAGPSRSQG